MHTREDLARLKASPGLHGARCPKCDYLFDAYDTPAPINDVLARLRGMRCPSCGKKRGLGLLMPWKYQERVEAKIVAEERREEVRKTADKYISRR